MRRFQIIKGELIRDEQEWCDINNVSVMNKEPSIIALLHIYGRFVHKHEARLDALEKFIRQEEQSVPCRSDEIAAREKQ